MPLNLKKSEIISDILMTYIASKTKKPDATQVRSNHKSEPEGIFKKFCFCTFFRALQLCVMGMKED